MMMPGPDRERIVALDRQRKDARVQLLGDTEQARHDLHPKTLWSRWTARQKAKATRAADKGSEILQKNAPLIGLAGAAILLLTARKPISDLYRKWRDHAPDAEDENR
jgi:hypothetical protein